MPENVKQYCRYCSWLIYGDAPYCMAKDLVKTDASIRRVIVCPEFALSPLGDVETGKMYHPRQERKQGAMDGQISMEDLW